MYKFLIPLFALALLIGCTPDETTPANNDPPTDSSSSMDTTSQNTTTPDTYNGQLLTGKHRVTMKTSKGDIVLELDADAAPKAVTNFVVLSNMGFYNGLTFHRVIPNFMIQGGDPNGDGTGGASIYGESFEDEPNSMEMVRGVIAMANRGPNTNGSQFFIVQAQEAPWLQGRHTIFGRVVEGMDIVDAIVNVPRDQNDKPTEAVTFQVEVEK